MTNRFPLIVDATTKQISEIPPTDNLDFTNNGIVNLDVARLGVTGGNNNEVLSTNGAGVLSWKPFVAPSVFRAILLANTPIASAAYATVVFSAIEFDTTGGAYSTVTGRFQPTTAGYYQLSASVNVGPSSVTTYDLDLFRNGGSYIRGSQVNATVNVMSGTVTGVVPFNGTTDFVEIKVFAVRTGGPIINGITLGVPLTSFSGHYIGPL